MEKETEIEALARMVANGFSSMEKRFNEVDARFEKVDARFDEIDLRFDEIDARFDRIENVVLETNRLIDNVVMPTQDDHARRIKNLELKIA